MKPSTFFHVALLVFFLSACNGGGSSNPNPDTGPVAEVDPSPLPEPEPDPEPEPLLGKNTLLIGHSFFRPASEHFEGFVEGLNISGHQQELVFSGGDSGTPIELWNNSSKQLEIQAALDLGDIELFGMTYTNRHPEADGYLLWVDYALQQNANTEIFIALPWIRLPLTVSGAEHATLWEEHHVVIHSIIDTLRAEHPDTNFYCIPYGATANRLQTLFESGNLPDVTDLMILDGETTAVYTDQGGHPGDILEIAGALVWLNAIYGVDLSTFDNGTSYITDLNQMAADIMAAHNTAYNSR